MGLLSRNTTSSIGNYVFGRTIGEGTYGKVKLATHMLTGTQVAIKIVDSIHAPIVMREIETWRHMHHPNIIRLFEVLCSETRIFMVMEYCTGGEAFEYICSHGKFEDRGANVRRVFRQIVEAVGYCHDKQFVHRDLKLENIMFTQELDVKLIDFGFTREVRTRNLLDTYCGSLAYAAPEMLSGQKYSGPAADVWSLGVILYTLLCGYLPFDDDSEAVVKRKILGLEYELPDFLCDSTMDLIQRLLKIDGSQRMSIKDVLSHPWFGDSVRTEDQHARVIGMPSSPSLTPHTNAEITLSEKLRDIGFDVDMVLQSVKNHSCDQASAMWYLLLEKQRLSSMTQPPPADSERPISQESLGTSEAPAGDYLAQARRKTLGDTLSVVGTGLMQTPDSSRRKLIIEAMRGSSSSALEKPTLSRTRRRWESGGSIGRRSGAKAAASPKAWIPEEGEAVDEYENDDGPNTGSNVTWDTDNDK
ncbi:kinase-like domain-containing protein [Gaertneriomyces semiglobifer]|nr:kinase-like domain-containing protein [Gaertneriomyces semiglobifer]